MMQYEVRSPAPSAYSSFGNSTGQPMAKFALIARRLSRTKTLVGGALCATGLAFFILGAWAGVTDSWPVRFPLQLIEGRPKPIAMMPESRHAAMDRAGRLLDYPGKIEVQCPEQGPGTAVILIAGQSNAANSGAERHATRYPDRVLNFVAGRCFVAASPLLGTNGFAGELWTPLADKLIESGAFDKVILAPLAVGATKVAQWAEGGDVNATMKPLVEALVSRYRITHVLWHQGESDLMLGTDADSYRKSFLSFAASLRAQGVEAPIYVSRATRCGPGWKVPNPVRTAQVELLDSKSGLKTGVDTDLLLEAQDRYDDCHFAASGQMKAAKAWAELLSPPQNATQLKTD
jgi:hypothetical protein